MKRFWGPKKTGSAMLSVLGLTVMGTFKRVKGITQSYYVVLEWSERVRFVGGCLAPAPRRTEPLPRARCASDCLTESRAQRYERRRLHLAASAMTSGRRGRRMHRRAARARWAPRALLALAMALAMAHACAPRARLSIHLSGATPASLSSSSVERKAPSAPQ